MTMPIDRDALYTEYYPKVFAYVRSKVSDYTDAEDVASNVFVKVYAKLDTYDSTKASISTWIYAITKNEVCDFYRKKKLIQIPYEENFGYLEEYEAGNYDVMLDDLYEGLKTLTDRQREIVILHYYDGLSHQQISDMMQISCVNTRKICSIALAKLREVIL